MFIGIISMPKNKKYPKIEPQFIKGAKNKSTHVVLSYDVYLSIFNEMKDLEKSVATLKTTKKKRK
jgi:hypothetical protein